MNATTPHCFLVNIGSGNGLVPSGNKPLPEPIPKSLSPYDITRPQWVNSFTVYLETSKWINLVGLRCKDLPDSNQGDFICQRAINSPTLVIDGCISPVKLPSDGCHWHYWWEVNIGSGNGLVPSDYQYLVTCGDCKYVYMYVSNNVTMVQCVNYC